MSCSSQCIPPTKAHTSLPPCPCAHPARGAHFPPSLSMCPSLPRRTLPSLPVHVPIPPKAHASLPPCPCAHPSQGARPPPPLPAW
eukprot:164869-Chlamydomonas_euryale.AAC.4